MTTELKEMFKNPINWLGDSPQANSPVFIRTLVGDAVNTLNEIGEIPQVKLEHQFYSQDRIKTDPAETNLSLYSILLTYKKDLEEIFKECSDLLAKQPLGETNHVPDSTVERLRVILTVLKNLQTRLIANQ